MHLICVLLHLRAQACGPLDFYGQPITNPVFKSHKVILRFMFVSHVRVLHFS